METASEGDGWRCLWACGCDLAEGPIWDPARKLLWFVDIEQAHVHRLDPVTLESTSWTAPCRVGAIGLRDGPGLIAATERGFAVIDPIADTVEWLGHPEPDLKTNRFNDGKVDAAGRFWAGTMDETKAHAKGTLYRLDPDRTWTAAATDYIITNGPTFSLDGRILYENDTIGRVTHAYDVADDGRLSGRRVFVDWTGWPGNPDGATTDAEGHLWVGVWGGWCVRRVSPAGEIVAEFDLPAANVTSCAFGGDDYTRLFVTCARQALDADALDAQPLAGGVFEILAPGVRGLPGGVFAG